MVESTQKELITLKGRLKMGIVAKTSEKSGDEYYYVPMEINETEKNGQKIDNQFDSIILMFWKKDFDSQTQSTIASLQENQNITVHGYLGGRDNGLLQVVELETVDSDADMFI